MNEDTAIEYDCLGKCPECGSINIIYTDNIQEEWLLSDKEHKIIVSRDFQCNDCCSEGG